MTRLALRRESRGGVIGIPGGLELSQVTGRTILRQILEYIPCMALHASCRCVLAGKRESGAGGMVEFRAPPLRAGMAQRAIFGEACRDVVGIIRRTQKLGAVASDAVG